MKISKINIKQRFPDLPGFPGSNEKESFRGLYETLEYMHNKREIQPEEKDKQSGIKSNTFFKESISTIE